MGIHRTDCFKGGVFCTFADVGVDREGGLVNMAVVINEQQNLLGAVLCNKSVAIPVAQT